MKKGNIENSIFFLTKIKFEQSLHNPKHNGQSEVKSQESFVFNLILFHFVYCFIKHESLYSKILPSVNLLDSIL